MSNDVSGVLGHSATRSMEDWYGVHRIVSLQFLEHASSQQKPLFAKPHTSNWQAQYKLQIGLM